jgi:membrane protein implicated in regulation of membrane protease activity
VTLVDFYLLCFWLGFIFSVVSMLSGHIDLHFDHGHFHVGGDGGHGIHAGNGADAAGHHAAGHTEADISPFNAATIAAFLAWFGGTGYLASHYYRGWLFAGLAVSTVSGLAGAAIVFWFLAKVLMREPEHLDPSRYDMIGVLGSVTGTIRPDGVGEILFSQEGFRRSAAARSEDGIAIPLGTEVVVTRYENGIAFVRRWEDLAGQ